MTNYEKIKAMSVEEMAGWFAHQIGGECYACPAGDICEMARGGCSGEIRDWLESEVEEDG